MRIFLPGLQISLFLSGRPFSTAEIHGWNITGVYSFERNFVLDSRETSLFTDNGEGDTTPKAAKEQATNKPALNVSRFFFRRALYRKLLFDLVKNDLLLSSTRIKIHRFVGQFIFAIGFLIFSRDSWTNLSFRAKFIVRDSCLNHSIREWNLLLSILALMRKITRERERVSLIRRVMDIGQYILFTVLDRIMKNWYHLIRQNVVPSRLW